MGELAPLGITGGGLAVFAYVIFALLRANRANLSQAEERIDAAERRADDAEKRATQAKRETDKESKLRREAENREAALSRKVEKLSDEIAQLRTVVNRLQEKVT